MASEVGSGQISIFPVFTGFRSRVNAEVGAASTAAGQSSGTQFGAAFGRGAGNVGADSAKALTKNVATASASLGKARLAEQDSAGKVRVAEAQLAEARSNGAAGSAKVIAAEERLEAAKRKLTEAQNKTKDSSSKLTEAQEKLQTATEATASSAEEGAEQYAKGWAGLKEKLSSTIRGALDEANAEAESSSGAGGEESGNAFTEGFKKAMGALAAVFAVDKVKEFFVTGIQGAGDLEQSVGAIEAVFKSGSAQMSAWSETAATDVGLTKNEFNELGTLMGAQLKNGGTAMDELAPKTGELITLGADLSSMFGGTTADAVGALSSALKGERDPIEAYGVSLKQANIDAEAAALGFEKVGGSLSDEGQQAATLSLIMKQTADAHGNFAAETDTAAHKQQVLAAKWADAKTQLSSHLLPAITAVTGGLSDALTPALGVAEKVMTEITGGVRAFGAAFHYADGDITSAGFAGFMEHLGFLASKIKPILTEFTGGMLAFGAAFKYADGDITSAGFPGFMERVGFLASQLVEKLTSVGGGLQGLLSGMDFSHLAGLASVAGGLAVASMGPGAAIAGLVGKFAPLIGSVGKLMPLLRFLTGPLGLLTGLFVAAYSTSEPFREAINGLVGTIGQLVTQLLGQLVPVFTTLVSTILPIVVELFTALVPVFAEVVTAIVPVVTQLIGMLIPVLMQLIQAVLPVLVQVLGLVAPIFTNLLAVIMPLVMMLLGVLIPVIQALLPVVQVVFQTIATIISAVMTIIQGIIQVVTGLITGNWSMVWDGIKNIISGVLDLIVGIIVGVFSIIAAYIEAAIGFWSGIFSTGITAIKDFFATGWSDMLAGITRFGLDVLAFFTDLPANIVAGLGDLGSLLLDSGKALIQGFIDGLSGMVGAVGDAVGGVMDFIGGFFPHSPAKRGPFSGRGYTSYSGAALAGDFAKGISSEQDKVAAAANAVMRSASLSGNVQVTGSSGTTATSPAQTSGGGGRLIEMNVYGADGMSAEAMGRTAADALNGEIRRSGG